MAFSLSTTTGVPEQDHSDEPLLQRRRHFGKNLDNQIIVRGTEIDSGSSGTVFEGKVKPPLICPEGCEYSSVGAGQVALKLIHSQIAFEREWSNVKDINNCLAPHDHITICHGRIPHNDPDVAEGTAKDFIVYERAFSDLDKVLKSPQSDQSNESPCSKKIQPHHVLEQLEGIISALEHLHAGFEHSGSPVSIAHNDIKPANILVFYPDNERYPVGWWKLGDFGLASMRGRLCHRCSKCQKKVRKSGSGQEAQSPSSAFLQNPATYCAPEVERGEILLKDGTQADIWSYGCLFTVVLARALGSISEVKNLQSAMSWKSNHDRFFERTDSPNGLRLKVKLVEWLNMLPDKYPAHRSWIKPSIDMIFEIFRVVVQNRACQGNPDVGVIQALHGRPDAKTIRRMIARIRREERRTRFQGPYSMLQTTSGGSKSDDKFDTLSVNLQDEVGTFMRDLQDTTAFDVTYDGYPSLDQDTDTEDGPIRPLRPHPLVPTSSYSLECSESPLEIGISRQDSCPIVFPGTIRSGSPVQTRRRSSATSSSTQTLLLYTN